jgi:hypothetical protein
MSKLDDLISGYRAEERVTLSRVREIDRMLSQAQRELDVIQAKLQGAQEAAKAVSGGIEPKSPKPRVATKKRTRALSARWKKILQIAHRDKEFGYDELAVVADLIGHSVGRDTLRSQMSLYKQGGLVEATEAGTFRLTEAGLKAAEIDRDSGNDGQNENEAPNGKPAGASEVTGWGATTPQTAFPGNPQSGWHS